MEKELLVQVLEEINNNDMEMEKIIALFNELNVEEIEEIMINDENEIEIDGATYKILTDVILKDFEFEFRCAKQELEFEKNPDDLWKMFDALNKDFVNYIDKWKDIRFYNNLEFEAYSYFDGIEYIKAEVKTYKK